MKKFFRIIWKIVSFPPLSILSLILSLVVMFTIDLFYNQIDKSYFSSIEDAQNIVFSDTNLMAAITNNDVFVVDVDYDTLNYKIKGNDLYKNAVISFKYATFDENDNLYVYYTRSNKDSISMISEEIAMFDPDGNFKKIVAQYTYDDYNFYNNRNGNIYGIDVEYGLLSYIYVDVYLQSHLISVSTTSSIGDDVIVNCLDDLNVVVDAVYTEDGFIVILTNGDIGYLYEDEFVFLVSSDDAVYESEGFEYYVYPSDLYYSEGRLFCRGQNDLFSIYEITENGFELFVDLYDEACDKGYEDLFASQMCIFTAPYYSNMYIGYSIDENVYYTDNDDDALYGEYANSIGNNIIYTILFILDTTSVFFFLYGIVFCFGNFVGWKFSLLTKQLLVTIPLVVVSFLIIFALFFVYVDNYMYSESSNEMIMFSKVCSTAFNGDELAAIDGTKEFVDSGLYREYVQMLNNFVFDNKQSWSSKYSLSLMLVNSDIEEETMDFIEIASSEGYTSPYGIIYHMDWIPYDLFEPSIGSLYITSNAGGGVVYYTSDAAIYDSNGNLVATVELNTDLNDLENQFVMLLLIALLIITVLLIILIVCISILTKFNVRKLKKASLAVSSIANGDFNSRIAKPGKDEVGQICKNVNDMASKLDVLFKEKDENEQFYYKFVPEQFKELLHKNKFTELSLGDAESVDLTVLFCDIRSFSLNSEMMTAKENFEFINIIYGKAGPIIRKHNGFVDKYIGDAVMALFEKADDAIACGKELYSEIVLNADTAKELNVSSINIGIGIHTGMARIGIVGEEERMSGTVISNTVNLSSRLESLTKQYNTAMIITKDTLDKMEDPDSLNLRYLGMIQVAGVNEVKALYEVLDCLDEERYVERFKSKADFREAVRLYHLGELKKSLGMFKSIKETSKSDPCLDTYIEYIEKMIKEENTDHNVFKFSRK